MNNEQQKPGCPLCGEELKISSESFFGSLSHNFSCMNFKCYFDFTIRRCTLDEALERFAKRPENPYEKAWKRLADVIIFSVEHGMNKTDFDYGYKEGLTKVIREMVQMSKEIKG